jgi:hypothetical protein
MGDLTQPSYGVNWLPAPGREIGWIDGGGGGGHSVSPQTGWDDTPLLVHHTSYVPWGAPVSQRMTWAPSTDVELPWKENPALFAANQMGGPNGPATRAARQTGSLPGVDFSAYAPNVGGISYETNAYAATGGSFWADVF